MTERRQLEIECSEAEEKVTSVSCAIGDLEEAVDKKYIELEKADKEVERLSTVLKEIDDADDGSSL